MERLCSKLSGGRGAAAGAAAPMPTEFRWVAIPLGMLIQSGTFAHRRKLLHRIVSLDFGLGKEGLASASALAEDARGGAGGGGGERPGALSHVDETWVARVLLPAVDQVGWHR